MKVTLTDVDGNTYKAEILFTHFDYTFGKNYIVYLIDDDLLASSYEEVDNNYVIKSSVNYPNNPELKYQKVTLDKDGNLKKNEVYYKQ